jgi:hypothetical protein
MPLRPSEIKVVRDWKLNSHCFREVGMPAGRSSGSYVRRDSAMITSAGKSDVCYDGR